MPFFQTDDQLPVNRKTKQLTAPVLTGDLTGLAALGLWTLAGAGSQATLTDGLISIHDLISAVYDARAATELARLLVDAGFWHAPGHDCPRCDPVPEMHWRFHDWWALGYDRGEIVRENRAKRREQQSTDIVAAVWARDCTDPAYPGIARCRYCGKTVKRQDRRSDPDDRPQLDHVDPTKAGGPTNLVVACGACNRRKARRTPREAGMTLRPAPRALGLDDTTAASPAPSMDAGTTVPPIEVPDAGVAASPAAQQPTDAGAQVPSSPGVATSEAAAATSADQISPGSADNQLIFQRPEVSSGARVGTRPGDAPGSGSGTGFRVGSPEGSPEGHPRSNAPAGRTRKRRRGRRGRPVNPQTRPAGEPAEELDAGPAPLVPVPGRFGSPWHGYHGPPNPLGDENHCPEHHQPYPCRKCEGAPA